jgi:hypothetical protein
VLQNLIGGSLQEFCLIITTSQGSKLKRAMNEIIKVLCHKRGIDAPDLMANIQGPLIFMKKSVVNRVGDLEGNVAYLGADVNAKSSVYVSQKLHDKIDNMTHFMDANWYQNEAFEKHCVDQVKASNGAINHVNKRNNKINNCFSQFAFKTVQF